MRITDSPVLTPGLLFGRTGRGALPAYLNGGGVGERYLYAYGRIALRDGLEILGCGRGDSVLLPSYICDVAVEPFYELGIKVRFYRVLSNLQPDIADIGRKIDQKTKAILAVNYFGFPQGLAELQGICQEHGIALIEDNAHGLLSRKDSRLLGTFGDIGFSSIWKVLPVPNGALLLLNNGELARKAQQLPHLRAARDGFRDAGINKYLIGSLLDYAELRCKCPSQYLRHVYQKVSSQGERSSYRDYRNARVKVSGLSLEIMKRVNPEEVVSKRRENYGFWRDRLGGRPGVTVIFESLPEGVCPLAFPVMADDAAGLASMMLASGIPANHWPYLPGEIKGNREYAAANLLAEHLLLLPVHQGLSRTHLVRAAGGLRFP